MPGYIGNHTISGHVEDSTNPHTVTKTQVGLGDVDNTADTAKPVSTAQQTALDGKSNTGHTHTESDITDLQSYLLNITAESVGDLSDVNVNSPADKHVLVYDGVDSFDNRLLVEADISDLGTYLTGVAWGDVTGTLSAQTDLQSALDGKSATTHDHDADYEAKNSNIQTHIANTLEHVTKQVDTVQTINATPTVVATIAIPTDEEKLLTIKAHGHEDVTDDHIWKNMTIGVKNIGGTASLVGSIDSAVGYDAGASTWTLVASVSSGNVIVTVTGEAAHTIDWRTTTEID